jgi:hypothetical protein
MERFIPPDELTNRPRERATLAHGLREKHSHWLVVTSWARMLSMGFREKEGEFINAMDVHQSTERVHASPAHGILTPHCNLLSTGIRQRHRTYYGALDDPKKTIIPRLRSRNGEINRFVTPLVYFIHDVDHCCS